MIIGGLKKVLDFRRWPPPVIISIPILAFIYVHFESHIVYHRIELGMSNSSVAQKFGSPDRREPTMLFCEKIFDWTGECPSAPHAEYQFFRTGIDRWVVVGFNRHGLVSFKSIGKL